MGPRRRVDFEELLLLRRVKRKVSFFIRKSFLGTFFALSNNHTRDGSDCQVLLKERVITPFSDTT